MLAGLRGVSGSQRITNNENGLGGESNRKKDDLPGLVLTGDHVPDGE